MKDRKRKAAKRAAARRQARAAAADEDRREAQRLAARDDDKRRARMRELDDRSPIKAGVLDIVTGEAAVAELQRIEQAKRREGRE